MKGKPEPVRSGHPYTRLTRTQPGRSTRYKHRMWWFQGSFAYGLLCVARFDGIRRGSGRISSGYLLFM